jgi:Metallo-beta-lactamase superfamily
VQITLLGTGSPIPDPRRAGPSTLVRSEGTAILVDCGRGVLMRLAGAGLPPPMLGAVLVTHLHSDHLTDFNDVITMHWVMSPQPVTLSVFGPPGMREVVDATLGALAPDIRYRLAHHADLTEPPSVEVTEVTSVTPSTWVQSRRASPPPTTGRSSRLPGTGSRRAGVQPSSAVRRSLRGARRAVQGRRRVRADRDPRGPRASDPERPLSGHRRLPLNRRGRGAHRRPRRRSDTRAHALRPADGGRASG